MTRLQQSFCTLVLCLLLLAALIAFSPAEASAQVRGRSIAAVQLDTVFALGSVNDQVFVNPIRIAASNGAVFAFDDADQALKAFSLTGNLVWSFGREGSGPGEFRKVRDVSVGMGGRVLLVDQSNRRLTFISAQGALEGEVALVRLGGSPEQVLQVGADDYVIWTLSPQDPPVVLMRGSGRLERRMEPPFSIASRIPYLGLQAQLANDPAQPERWVYALDFADRWLVFDRMVARPEDRRMIEELPLPEVNFEDHGRLGFSGRMGKAYRGARSVAVVGDTMFVLYGGRTEQAGGLVDTYGLQTGEYQGTIVLPKPAVEIAASRGWLFVLEREDVPRLVAYRRRGLDGTGGS